MATMPRSAGRSAAPERPVSLRQQHYEKLSEIGNTSPKKGGLRE